MDDQDQRALNALLDIIADRKMWIGRRVEAAETILAYSATPKAAYAARVLLLYVAENPKWAGPEFLKLRIKALRLIRKSLVPRASAAPHGPDANYPGLADAVRQARLAAPQGPLPPMAVFQGGFALEDRRGDESPTAA